jgi:hypothetical protein
MVDINSRVLFGDDLLHIVHPQARRLSCWNPCTKNKYTHHLSSHFKWHKLLNHLHTIYASVHGPLTESQQCERKGLSQRYEVHQEEVSIDLQWVRSNTLLRSFLLANWNYCGTKLSTTNVVEKWTELNFGTKPISVVSLTP